MVRVPHDQPLWMIIIEKLKAPPQKKTGFLLILFRKYNFECSYTIYIDYFIVIHIFKATVFETVFFLEKYIDLGVNENRRILSKRVSVDRNSTLD